MKQYMLINRRYHHWHLARMERERMTPIQGAKKITSQDGSLSADNKIVSFGCLAGKIAYFTRTEIQISRKRWPDESILICMKALRVLNLSQSKTACRPLNSQLTACPSLGYAGMLKKPWMMAQPLQSKDRQDLRIIYWSLPFKALSRFSTTSFNHRLNSFKIFRAQKIILTEEMLAGSLWPIFTLQVGKVKWITQTDSPK